MKRWLALGFVFMSLVAAALLIGSAGHGRLEASPPPPPPGPPPMLMSVMNEWYHIEKTNGYCNYKWSEYFWTNVVAGVTADMGIGVWHSPGGDHYVTGNKTDNQHVDFLYSAPDDYTLLEVECDHLTEVGHDKIGDLNSETDYHVVWSYTPMVSIQDTGPTLDHYGAAYEDIQAYFSLAGYETIVDEPSTVYLSCAYCWDDSDDGPHSMALALARKDWSQNPPVWDWDIIKTFGGTYMAEGGFRTDAVCTNDKYRHYCTTHSRFEWDFAFYVIHNVSSPTLYDESNVLTVYYVGE